MVGKYNGEAFSFYSHEKISGELYHRSEKGQNTKNNTKINKHILTNKPMSKKDQFVGRKKSKLRRSVADGL